MSEPLAIYLHDHLAGADFGIGLLNAIKERQIEGPTEKWVAPLLAAIEEDRATLREFTEGIGFDSSVIKEVIAWMSEKATRVKLGPDVAGIFGEFQALELLALGIVGKQSLWLALQTASKLDARLRGLDLERLITRAREQYDKVEERRIELAANALAPEALSATPAARPPVK